MPIVLIMRTRVAGNETYPISYIDVDGNPLTPPTGASEAAYNDSAGARTSTQTSDNGQPGGTAGLDMLTPVWSTGITSGTTIIAVGLLMFFLTKGLAAVVFWPLGAFTVIMGTTVLGTTLAARRATRRLTRNLGLH